MTTVPKIIDEAESLITLLAEQLTRPRDGECLCCYVARQLDEYPCNGTHRHALRYRDAMAPRATALIDRLGDVGACCCDCELFMNGYVLRSQLALLAEQDEFDDELPIDEPEVPACAGVRRGSVQPCANWVRQRWR